MDYYFGVFLVFGMQTVDFACNLLSEPHRLEHLDVLSFGEQLDSEIELWA